MAEEAPPVFAVTTRSRLRGPWLFPVMLVASIRVRRQLAADSRAVRWASVVAGPCEFWTITVWRNRHEMQEFMRSGAHDDIMWLFSRWLSSFWLMRWRPGPLEIGTWKGLSLAQPERSDGGGPAASPALQRALDHLPWLRAATGVDGAARFDETPYARRRRAEVGRTGGVVVHVHVPWPRTPVALRALRRLRDRLGGDAGVARAAVGVGRPGDVYLLFLCDERARARTIVQSPEVASLLCRWPGRVWVNEWLPENEFGHWDGFRLRRRREGSAAVPMPPAARRATE